MNKQSAKYLFTAAIILVALMTACQGTNPQAGIDATAPVESATTTPSLTATAESVTPTPSLKANDVFLWENKDNTAGIKALLGDGLSYALAIAPDGKTLVVAGLQGLSAYDFNTLERLWLFPIDGLQKLLAQKLDLIWSPDGNYLATSSNGAVFIWDAHTGKLLSKRESVNRSFVSIAWASDGKLLTTAAPLNKTGVSIWDAKTGQQLSFFETKQAVRSLGWKPQGDIVAISIANKQFDVWNISAERQVHHPLQDNKSFTYIGNLKWSGDGTHIASVGESGYLIVWNAQSGEQLFMANGNIAMNTMAWSPDDSIVATGLRNGTIVLWDAKTGQKLQQFKRKQSSGTREEVLSLVWSPDGKNLVSLSNNEPITVWDVQTGDELRSRGTHTGWGTSIAWSPDGSLLAWGSEDGGVTIWDPLTSKKTLSLQNPNGWVYGLAWSPDGKRLAVGGERTVTIWDAQTGQELKSLSEQGHGINGVAWSSDGRLFASISGDGKGIVWDGSTYKRLRFLNTKDEVYSMLEMAWSPDGKWLGCYYWPESEPGNRVSFWNPETGEKVDTKDSVSSLAWSPTSNTIASIDDTSETIILWNANTKQELYKFNMSNVVFDIAWSPNGKLLLIAESTTLFVVDPQTGEKLHTLNGPKDSITDVAWSPRGDLVAATSWDGRVIIWGIDVTSSNGFSLPIFESSIPR